MKIYSISLATAMLLSACGGGELQIQELTVLLTLEVSQGLQLLVTHLNNWPAS